MLLGWDKSGTKVKKDGILESENSESFSQKFYSAKRFYRGFAVSGAQNIQKGSIFVRKDATSELDFEAENLHFHYKMWSGETALKRRKKTIFEPLREEPQSPKSGETEENMVFQASFGRNSPVRCD